MKTNYLLPHQLKKIGWFILIIGLLSGIYYLAFNSEPDFLNVTVLSIAGHTTFFSLTNNNILDEITGLLLITGSIFMAFSKEKSEDELISRIRLESLVWATYINYFILILAILFIYDMTFFWVLVFNMFTILFFFIIRFNWALYKLKNQMRDEE